MKLLQRTTLILLSILVFSIAKSFGQVTANFSSNVVTGCSPLVVQFSDLSTGSPTSWNWTFGNSNTSVVQNPSAIYTNPGQYTVTLTVSNGSSNDTETKTNYITVYASPTADFLQSDDTTCIGTTVTFTDASTIAPGGTPIATWNWDYGDGFIQTVSSSPTTHSYSTNNTFPVSLIVTDQNGCTDAVSHNMVITNFANPTFTATPTTSCTAPLTVDFTMTSTSVGGATFLWRFGDGTTSTSQNPSYTYTNPGSYNVTLIVTQGGCVDSTVVNNSVVIQNMSAVFTPSATSVCSNTAVSFNNTSSPNPTINAWDFGDSGTSAIKNPSHTYTAAGTYTVTLTATDANGCVGTATTTITVDVKPVVTFTSNITQSCVVPATINFTETTTGGSVFDWDFGDGGSSTTANPSHIYTSGGTFDVQLVVSNATGTCSDSLTVTNYITITRPVANFTTNPDSGCVPINITFNGGSSSSPLDPIATYQWDFDDGNTASGSTTTTNNNYTTQGTYSPQLIVITTTGCRDTFICNNCIKVGITPNSNFNIVDNTICYGQLANFIETATGETGYKWLFGDGGNSLVGNATHNYADTGTFQVQLIAYNNGCADTSAPQNIRIDGPKGSFTRTMSCVNYFDVDFLSTSVIADSVYWDFGDGNQDLTNNPSPAHTYATRGVKTVTMEVYNFTTGCADTVTVNLTIAVPIAAFTISSSNGCYPFNPTFNGTSSQDEASYAWDFGDPSTTTDVSTASSPNYIYTTPSNYTVSLVVTDVNGCKDSTTSAITALGPVPGFYSTDPSGCTPWPITFVDSTVTDSLLVSYTWDFGDGNSVTSNNDSITHIYTTPGNYDVTMTVSDTSGCVKTVTYTNYVLPTYPFPALTVDTFACASDVLTFNANATAAVGETYFWDFGDGTLDTTNTGSTTHAYTTDNLFTVTLTVVDTNGCDSTITTNIRILKPTANFSMTILNSSCGSLQSSFTDASTGFVTSWLWSFGTGSTSVQQNPIFTYTQAGTYDVSLIVTNSGGCKDTLVQVGLAIVPGPVGTYVFAPDSGCNPLTVTFDATSPNAENYFWDMGDGTVISGTADTTYTYVLEGIYTPILVLSNTMTGGAPCQLPATNLSGTIQVINLIDVTLNPTSLTLIEDSSATVTATTSGGAGPYTYSWSPTTSLDCSSNCSLTEFTGTTSDQMYYITSTDVNGCKGIDSIFVVSTPCENTTTTPNFFSPNADESNDVFFIPGVCKSETYNFKIFDRWGLLIFESNFRKQSWDGRTTAGVEAPDGVYYYILQTAEVTYKGYVQLSR